jgi:Icc-related predicted phosphoesterase
MKIDYTSDLHLDTHIQHSIKDKSIYIDIFEDYFKHKKSDILIIAGDLGHNIEQNSYFLKLLKTEFGYKDILTVEGNHSGYLMNDIEKSKFKNGLEKIKYTKEVYLNEGIKILDGNSYDIIDKDRIITIGGCDSFYDGSYLRPMDIEMFNIKNIVQYWKGYMPDSRFMNLNNFQDYAKQEKDKLLKLYEKCDIVVTHVKPVSEIKYFQGKYKGKASNAFFGFNWGNKIIDDKKLKIWVYGHSHEEENFEINGKKLLCNPYGYQGETFNKIIKSFTI